MTAGRDTIAEWSRAVRADAARVAENIARDLAAQIRAATPVDTGRARDGWRVAASRPAGGEGGAEGVENQVSPEYGTRDFSIRITNGAPYIRVLEYGRAGVAPAAMVRRAVAGFSELAARAAAEIKKGGRR